MAIATQDLRIVRAPKGQHPYFVMCRETAQNRTLSWEARGMLAYLLSKPNDWEVQIADLQQGCGRDKVYKILKELSNARYLSREQVFGKKHKIEGWAYRVHELPYPEKTDMDSNPHPENPCPDLPDTENPLLHIKDSKENTESTDEREDIAPSTSNDVPGARAEPSEPKTDDVAEWLQSKAQPALQESIEDPIPPVSSAPPFPQPPPGQVWVASSASDQPDAHLCDVDKWERSKPRCKINLPHRYLYVPDTPVNRKSPCKACMLAASEQNPSKGKRRAERKPLEWDVLTDAICTHLLGAKDRAGINACAWRAGKIMHGDKSRPDIVGLREYEYERQRVASLDYEALAKDVPVFMAWYRKRCPGCDLKDAGKFMDYWQEWRGQSDGQTTPQHASQSTETRTVSGGDLKEQLRKYRGNGSAPRGEIGTAPPEIIGAIPKRDTRA